MLNMIKMELYRMFRSKSLYVIWAVMAVAIIFNTAMSKEQYDLVQEQADSYEEFVENVDETEGKINIGMSVYIPMQPGESITVFDVLFAGLQPKFIALFLVIFAVIFSSADSNSGYIKNIGGQVKNREKLIGSKAIALIIFTIVSMAIAVGIQIIANSLFFGYLELGNLSDLAKYLLVQTVLHTALVLIGMALSIVLKSNLVSMIIVVCLCMNLSMVIYAGINTWLQNIGIKDINIIDYTVTGKISMLPMVPANQDCVSAIMVAVVFGVVVTALTGVVFKRRDI